MDDQIFFDEVELVDVMRSRQKAHELQLTWVRHLLFTKQYVGHLMAMIRYELLLTTREYPPTEQSVQILRRKMYNLKQVAPVLPCDLKH